MTDFEQITLDQIALETIKEVPAASGLHDIIRHRWSPRSFSEKAVSAEDLTKVFTAASWAASSNNEQPWRFLVGRKGTDTYAKILDSLVEFNQKWASSAPVLYVSAAKSHFSKDQTRNGFALHDTGAASATLSLEAAALGLHTHGMGGFSKDKIRTHFSIPDDFEIGAAWALGYLGEPTALPGFLQTMETAPRSRKPLADLVFNKWNEPATFSGIPG